MIGMIAKALDKTRDFVTNSQNVNTLDGTIENLVLTGYHATPTISFQVLVMFALVPGATLWWQIAKRPWGL
jgi:hypothetical protein